MIIASAALIDDNGVGVIAILSVFIGAPLAIAYARTIWKRSSDDRPRSALADNEAATRLLQMQQSIDAMAVEIERISEGQRFVTKVLSERPPEAIAPGDPAAKVAERPSRQGRART
jgi:hypothetical protein